MPSCSNRTSTSKTGEAPLKTNRYLPLALLAVALTGCGERTEVGDSPAAINARKGTDPDLAEKRAKHQMTAPPPEEGEGSRY